MPKLGFKSKCMRVGACVPIVEFRSVVFLCPLCKNNENLKVRSVS